MKKNYLPMNLNEKHSKEQALRDTIQELKIEAGLTEVQGPGITLTIEPIIEEIQIGAPVQGRFPRTSKKTY